MPHSDNSSITQDALADVLNTIKLNATTYFCTDFHPPWGMEIAGSHNGVFHIVIEGQAWLRQSPSDPFIHLDTGDIVAFPTGGPHWISDKKDSQHLPGNEVVEQVLKGETPFDEESDLPATRLLCGSFNYDTSVKHPFLKDLPCFIHIKAAETDKHHWLKCLIGELAYESRTPSPGSSVMVSRLTEMLFIQLIRAYISQSPDKLCYMMALADKQIGAALNLIHGEEQAYLSVEKLSEAVAMSRTSFTEKFTRLVGNAPKSYLINNRMMKAKHHLTSTLLTTIEIAELAGYSSEAAFSKAFKQFFGLTPGQARKGRDGAS
ncbi:AraC family transcriptional regulator [Teredinibacter sp. KSP-S5-2]|uniref:AraC family transcriptional regulator n=1 Tax=Teredinibacter sp. KSP-S5-2 TaxID=3034506 RepID=UPI002934A23C|nr:AraC family transcriptional regulator [Teredinibacter sp. KSP-S5-2]WNO08391.1 AraC family transcriptional regulator [Teredinibacter sp. KSP-S5-2]